MQEPKRNESGPLRFQSHRKELRSRTPALRVTGAIECLFSELRRSDRSARPGSAQHGKPGQIALDDIVVHRRVCVPAPNRLDQRCANSDGLGRLVARTAAKAELHPSRPGARMPSQAQTSQSSARHPGCGQTRSRAARGHDAAGLNRGRCLCLSRNGCVDRLAPGPIVVDLLLGQPAFAPVASTRRRNGKLSIGQGYGDGGELQGIPTRQIPALGVEQILDIRQVVGDHP